MRSKALASVVAAVCVPLALGCTGTVSGPYEVEARWGEERAMSSNEEGRLLWTPTAAFAATTRIERYRRELAARGVETADYAALQRWSVREPEAFWSSLLDHFAIEASGSRAAALSSRRPGEARWFPGLALNYARHALRHPGESLGRTVRRFTVEAFSQQIAAALAERWAAGPEPSVTPVLVS